LSATLQNAFDEQHQEFAPEAYIRGGRTKRRFDIRLECRF
jgi:hypothetical protein